METVNNCIREGRDARIDIIKGIAILLVLWGARNSKSGARGYLLQ